jgi:hypothetical protein
MVDISFKPVAGVPRLPEIKKEEDKRRRERKEKGKQQARENMPPPPAKGRIDIKA